MNQINEFGQLVVEGRQQRGVAPWDNSVRDIREFVDPKKEFKYKAPPRDVDEIPAWRDSGTASGSGGTPE